MKTRDSFWNETNPCIRNLRYTGPTDIFRSCGWSEKPCPDMRGSNILRIQPNENLVFRDLRVNVFTPKNLQIIHKLGLIPQNKNWDYFKRILARLLLNPSPYNTQLIQEKRKELSSIHFHLSTHIRCAGYLSDEPEFTIRVTPKQLLTLPNEIRKVLSQLKLGKTTVNMYLSTDSTIAEEYIKGELKSVNIYSLGRRRGHSTHGDNRNLRMSLLDLYTMCLSKHFLGTSSSNFSKLSPIICNYTSFMFFNAIGDVIKNFTNPSN